MIIERNSGRKELWRSQKIYRANAFPRNEIGSEFWDVPTISQQNSLFSESTQWFLSGRSALKAIIKELGEARSVSLPSWCCDSMIKPFVDAHYSINFYPVYFERGLVQEVDLNADVLFVMDYFGYTGTIPDLSNYKGTVIRDITHSLFSSTYSDADYYFGSLRKWCGVWTGGYLCTGDRHKLEIKDGDDQGYTGLRQKAMAEKAEYIRGTREDKGYLEIFDKAEDALEHVGIVRAAYRDVEMLKRLDVKEIKNWRKANAEVLRTAFPDWLIFPYLLPTDTPMFVPVLVPDGKRDVLRRHLIENDIYCPVHWPVSEYHRLDERTAHIYQNELSLVCDQRYTENDMYRMVETIRAYMEE